MSITSTTNSSVCGISSTLNQAKPYVLANVKLQIRKKGKDVSRIVIFGSPGCGKSAFVKDMCIENGYAMKCIYLSNITDDQASGIPCRIVDGERAKFTPSELVNMDESSFDYLPPNYVKGETPIVLFLDDIHLASKGMQKYLFQLLSYGAINNYKLPDNCAIVMAGNRTNDRACATSICSPVINRCFVIEVHSQNKDWLTNYAFKNGVRNDITSFLHSEMGGVYLNGQPLENAPWASARSWANFSEQLDCFESEIGTANLESLRVIANGFLGAEIASKWIEHREMISKWNVPSMAKMSEKEIRAFLEDSFQKNPSSAQGMVRAVMIWLLDSGIKSKFNAKSKSVEDGLKSAYNLLATAITVKADKVQIRPIVISGFSYLADYKKTIKTSAESTRFMGFLKGFLSGMQQKRPQDWILYDTFITLFDMELDKGDDIEIAKAKKFFGYDK